ncbi:MAG: type II toxin-antitoxin system RelE/ParE family toxin [Pseudomonadota bacterium]
MKLVFFETPLFTSLVGDYLTDESYRELQLALIQNPEMGSRMPGTGGFRKVRWEDARRGKGKRGGLRVIYYYLSSDNQVWFFTLYDKDEASNLNAKEKKILKNAIQAELEARRTKR